MEMTRTEPTFLFGLGAQKAGTSWLHDYLAKSEQANFGFTKEYHCYDALYLSDCRFFLERRDPSLFHKPIRFLRSWHKAPWLLRREEKRRALRETPLAYPHYFKGLVSEQPGVILTGDFTPEHAGLSTEVLKEIRDRLVEAGFQMRTVFVMRDPVERCFSASRMYLGRSGNSRASQEYAAQGLDISHESHAFTPHAEMRTRYDVTLANAEAAFGSEAIFTTFYETLFSSAETRRLTDWLGIEPVSADFDRRVNQSRKVVEGDDHALRTRIANHYRPVYEDMMRRFGEDHILQLWPSATLLE